MISTAGPGDSVDDRSPADISDPLSSWPRIALWVGAVAAAVRLAYFAEHAASPLFTFPTLDEKYYDSLARALFADDGGVARLNPGFRPFLYPFFLSAIYGLSASWGPVLAIAVQHLLGVATTLLVAALAARLWRRPAAGAVAGLLYALAGPPVFFEGELLITTLFTFLCTLLLWLLATLESPADTPAGTAGWALAGTVLGLAVQARTNALLLAAALAAAPFLGGPEARRRARGALAALAALVAVHLVFATLQSRLIGRFQLLPGAGGVNLYLGNERGADGMVPRQDRPVSYGDEYLDSVQLFSMEVYVEERGRPPEGISAAAVSRYWVGRALDEIAAEPGSWLRLVGRKLWLLAWNREIPNNRSFGFARDEESIVLRWLPVRWWLLLSLAPVGAWIAWRRRLGPPLGWILAFVSLQSLGVVLFFVNARYRLPLWPAMAVLAGGALVWMVDTGRRRHLGPLAWALGVAAALAVLSGINWLGAEPPGHAKDFFYRSLAHLERGDLEAARRDAHSSLELDPSDPAVHLQLGNVHLAAGRAAKALSSFRAAAALHPTEPRIANNLGVAEEKLGRPGAAYRSYLRALELAPDYAPAAVNAALLELRAGRPDLAAPRLERAAASGFDAVTRLAADAFLARAQGDEPGYRQLFETARRRDPEATERLLEDHLRPLPATELGWTAGD